MTVAAGATPALVVKGLRAGYPGVPVLRGLDLMVPAGALAAILGGSGSGKTTLLRAVAGFHPLEGGTIDIDGERVTGARADGAGADVPPERRRVGLVPQEGALFGHLDVAANVGFGLRRADRKGTRVEEMLSLVGLDGYGARMPAELSGGQQQRVALARALAPSPALVLLDEPFTALDTGLRAEVRAHVLSALRAAGATAVLVTHDQEEALGCADVVAVLRDGRVVQAGAPREIYLTPVDLGVGTFVGDAVVLPTTAVAGRADTALGRVPVVGPDGPGFVLLRPEQLRLSPARRTPGEVTATVVQTVFHGHDTTVLLDVDGVTVRCRTADQSPFAAGHLVAVHVEGFGRVYPAGASTVATGAGA